MSDKAFWAIIIVSSPLWFPVAFAAFAIVLACVLAVAMGIAAVGVQCVENARSRLSRFADREL